MKMQLKTGQKVIATAGTQLALSSSSVWAYCLKFLAPSTNTGAAYVGDSTVDATTGLPIAAGSAVAAPGSDNPEIAINLNAIYGDVTTNGDVIAYAYLEPAP
jgi:hypothetical protein